MSKFVRVARVAVTLAGLGMIAVPAAADPAALLGVSKNWKAFSSGTGSDKVCYSLSQPHSSQPKKAKREAIGFLINDWPSRRARAQPEIVPGYQFKQDSQITVQVGSDKFTFFSSNEGGSGSAWMKSANDEARLIDAMQRGSQAVVTGISAHGTMTHDTYSLGGLSESLTKIHTACGM